MIPQEDIIKHLLSIGLEREAGLIATSRKDSSIAQLVPFRCVAITDIRTSHDNGRGSHALLELHVVKMRLQMGWNSALDVEFAGPMPVAELFKG